MKTSAKGPRLSLSKGEMFGNLTIVNYDSKKQSYVCKCSCGSEKDTYAYACDLKSGKIKSCGCLHGKRPSLLPGEKYNRLTVIRWDRSKKKYEFRCDCGNTSYVQASIVKNGKQKSCGCLRDEQSSERMFKPGFAAFKHRIYLSYVNGAKQRNYKFDLTETQVLDLISKDCFYCGSEPQSSTWAIRTYKFIDGSECKVNGIDRKDNSLGYSVDNCVPCCYSCNVAKMDKSYDEWMSWIQRLIQFQTKSRE